MKSNSFLILALLAITATACLGDACHGDDYGTAGDFDFYVYVQSWPAQFCQAHSDWPGCSDPTNWQQHNLTLHGMWPNYDASQDGHDWPQCCQSVFGTDIDPAVAAALLPEFQTYWPNEQDPTGGDLANSLWDHEWNKHGTCSGLAQKAYFQAAMNIELATGTPAVISNNVGGSINLSDLQSAYGATDCQDGAECPAAFNCDNDDGQFYLSSITTCYDQNLSQIVCPASVLSSQGALCTDPTVYIQSF